MARQLEETSFLYGTNSAFIEDLYAQFLVDPRSVDQGWHAFFTELKDNVSDLAAEVEGAPWQRSDWPPAPDVEGLTGTDLSPPSGTLPLGTGGTPEAGAAGLTGATAEIAPPTSVVDRSATLDSIRALMLIRSYRVRGHLKANLDPLGISGGNDHPELDPKSYGFTDADLDRPIFIDYVLGLETATLREIVEILQRTYCSSIGIEFMHISEPDEKSWLQQRIEGREKEVSFTNEGKLAILNKLIEAEGFEQYLAKKYTGTKRFGIDGGESLIPALEQIIKRGGALGVAEIIIGMPHRGRLNVLANVMNKPFSVIFSEFQGGASKPEEVQGSGDVKYHLGTSSDREFDGNNVHLSLSANPSHLEAIDPVVLGKARAKQTQRGDKDRGSILPVLMHGDAAFAGQGLVAECFGLSGLKGHRAGGTIHIVVNNQIGFTTSPRYSRSSPYPSDVAKMVQAPIFHVNGDDPEAVVHVAKVATEFRQKFHKDVVIDMFCYRRFGHNEGDEPAFTQPMMYARIAKQPTTASIHSEKLIAEGLIKPDDVVRMKDDFATFLDIEFKAAESYKPNKADWLEGRWSNIKAGAGERHRGKTGVPVAKLKDIGKALTTVPEDFHLHRTLTRLMAAKKKMFEGKQGFDWATGEALAFGSLLKEGYGVRLVGQDSRRGTFSQRHSALVDQVTEDDYFPLNNLAGKQAEFEVIDSMLSEAAVLGFEYGYSMAEPNALVLWEAQFGDFANGAQVIIDQFIASGESKWLRLSGLVMLLPHGQEGQGPEHSSARLERYLQLCAEDNMQVCYCTTPANYFHVLRRQMHRTFRKPLILMTPKSLLRHKRAVSFLADMGPKGEFHRIFWDHAQSDPASCEIKLVADDKIRQVVLCSGKVYYDLLEARDARGIDDVYLLRVEQIYPFPDDALEVELARFGQARMVWCQEEPQNMGAWTFVEPLIEEVLVKTGARQSRATYVGRPRSASPAAGNLDTHVKEQSALIDAALASD